MVTSYEPLPENFSELIKNISGTSFVLVNKAGSNFVGTANLIVPSRLERGSTEWTEGTSYNGYIETDVAEDIVKVNVTRLDLDSDRPFDFVKLALQGGELKAILGLGDTLKLVKLLYIETQLLAPDGAANFVNKQGFVTFFDGIQFGLNIGLNEVPYSLLHKYGIEISKIHLPEIFGYPLILWGHLQSV